MQKKKFTDVVMVEREPFGAPYVIALAVVHGPDHHAMHRITKAETTIGRSDEADFTIEDSQISSLHCKVRVNGNLFSLVELGSTNGTMLNNNIISEGTPVRLKNFDEIQLGKTRLLFIANRFHQDSSS
jgi:pSer/pThr/pTyr-binding forkhead associated (FHA) protein